MKRRNVRDVIWKLAPRALRIMPEFCFGKNAGETNPPVPVIYIASMTDAETAVPTSRCNLYFGAHNNAPYLIASTWDGGEQTGGEHKWPALFVTNYMNEQDRRFIAMCMEKNWENYQFQQRMTEAAAVASIIA